MAGSRDIKAGGAHVELTIRDKIAQGLQRASGKLKAFAAGVRTIGTVMSGLGVAFGGASFVGAAKIFSDAGSEIYDMSKRTGLATEQLSELKYAAEQTGATIQDVERAIRFMSKQGIDPNKFDETLKAVGEIADDAERAQAAMKIFGKGGTALLPMAGELAGLRAEARELGVSMSGRQAALADELGDEFGRFKTALQGLVYVIGEAMAPSMIVMTSTLVAATQALQSFTKSLIDNSKSAFQKFGGWFEGQMKDGPTGPQGMAFRQLALWMQGKPNVLFPEKANRNIPDLSGIGGLLDLKAGATSRGQFSGFRAESLAVGSGGGVEKKLDGIKAVLERIHVGIKESTDAIEEIDGEEFS